MDTLPPYDLAAERATLGSLLLNREAIVAVDDWLKSQHFYLERHGMIYAAVQACYLRRVPPDIATVADELRRQGRLEQIGGMEVLAELMGEVPTAQHVEHYGRIVERAASFRALITAGGRIVALGYAISREYEDVIGDAQAELTKAHTQHSGAALVPIRDTIAELMPRLNSGAAPGIPTGLTDYDTKTGGLHDDELVVIAGRPGHGKSSLALTIADALIRSGAPVAYFSLEMGRDQLVMRQLAMQSGVDLMTIRENQLSSDQARMVVQAMGRISDRPLCIDDSGNLTVADVRTRSLRFAGEYGKIGAVVVDYLQLMSGSSKDRVQEVSEISRGLKKLSRELSCPVLALSQLSRAVENRASKVPMLSDLRESGAIEQDADQVVFVYREELYEEHTDKKGIVELHIAKHRNGPTGVVALRFNASTTHFQNLERYRAAEGY